MLTLGDLESVFDTYLVTSEDGVFCHRVEDRRDVLRWPNCLYSIWVGTLCMDLPPPPIVPYVDLDPFFFSSTFWPRDVDPHHASILFILSSAL